MNEKRIFNDGDYLDENIVNSIINEGSATDSPEEIKAAIKKYAGGNPGVSRVLTEHSKDFKTVAELEKLVGWALKDHTPDKNTEIWDKLK